MRNDTQPMHFRLARSRPCARARHHRLLFICCALLALISLGAAPAGVAPAHLAWRSPQSATHWVGQSTVNVTVTYDMSSVLRAMAGHRADPVTIIEERTRNYTAAAANGQVDVDDVFSRHHGGPDPSDTTVKTRTRKQILDVDPTGQTGLEPYLCKDEPPLNDADSNPTAFTACTPSQPSDERRYQDPGDAALAQFPAGPIAPGSSWSFTRHVIVEREFATGTLTYVDTLERIEQRNGHQIAVIDVAATGRVDLASDLQARGFHTGTMSFSGTGEFDMTSGMPDMQHYTGHADWHAAILGANIGLALDEIYDGKPWSTSAS
jgi:hypothetical protein